MDSENLIFVYATNEEGTAAALRHAARTAGTSGGRVVILVPLIVGYGSPLTNTITTAEKEALSARYKAMAAEAGLDVSVRCATAREAKHLPARLLIERARIIVGGRTRAWRATLEQQLARDLACEGHDVTFVDAQSGQPLAAAAVAHA
jgi:hypothetical protein